MKPRTRDPERTRRALKQAATALFARRGFAGATADRIARRAGVNKAMINYHFGGKRGLYAAILRESFSALVARLHAIADARVPPPHRLRNFIATFADVVAEAPDLPAMLMREMLTGGEHPDLAGEVFEYIPQVLGMVRAVVEAGIRDGSFREVNPLLTHLGLMGSLMFFFATEDFRRRVVTELKLAPAPPSKEQFVRHLQDLMTRGIVADRGRASARKR